MSYVIKRGGQKEPIHFDKVTARISTLTNGLDAAVDPVRAQLRGGRGLTGLMAHRC